MVQSLSKPEPDSADEFTLRRDMRGEFYRDRSDARTKQRFFSLELASNAVIDNVRQEEIQHLDRRLHRILDQPELPAIILDALVVEPAIIKQAVMRFVKSCDTIGFENLIIIVRESQLDLPGWQEYRKWFRQQLDDHDYGGKIACLVVQDDCPECEALACWVAMTDSVILTDIGGLGEFVPKRVVAVETSDFTLHHWLAQLQLLGN